MSSAYIDTLTFKLTERPKLLNDNIGDDKPSVEISFTAKNIVMENGMTAKLKAKYIPFKSYEEIGAEKTSHYAPESILDVNGNVSENSFSQTYLNSNMNLGLKTFLCPGFERIYVKVQKTYQINGTYLARFEFYVRDPQTTTTKSFAQSTCTLPSVQGTLNTIEKFNPTINNPSNGISLGEFHFGYSNSDSDELFYMDGLNSETKFFNYVLDSDIDSDNSSGSSNLWADKKIATLFYQDEPEGVTGKLNDEYYNSFVVEDGEIKSSKNYWDFTKDLDKNKLGYYCLAVCLIDNENTQITPWQSTKITCVNSRYNSNELAYFNPVFQYDRTKEFNPEYCTTDEPHFVLTVPNDGDYLEGFDKLMDKVLYYRYSEALYSIDSADWLPFSILNDKTQFDFYMKWLSGAGMGGEILDGEKTIYLQISDGVGNTSIIANDGEWTKDSIRNITLYRQKPNSIVFNVIGSSGSEYYTGMRRVDKDGKIDAENKIKDFHFVPSNEIKVMISAQDNLGLKLEYQLFIGNSSENTEWIKFDAGNNNYISFYLEPQDNDSIFRNAYSVTLNLIFRSEAGVLSDVQTKNIYYNTQILKVDNINLREKTSSYTPIVEYYNGDEWVGIPEQESFNSLVPKRSWDEIFYPNTHSFPLTANGKIDVNEALKVKDGDSIYDAVKIEEITSIDSENKEYQTKKIVYDSEQRPITIWNDTKKYSSLVSNTVYNPETGSTENFEYWIIDNTGYTDFQLEFEHFHLDETIHTQINDQAPYKGDCLVIYDAQAEGATTEYIDKYGRIAYKLKDSTKLKQLAAYTGDGVGATRLFPLENAGSLNATSNGAFVTEKFTTTNRICLIFYSDGSENNKSGFKIKASPVRNADWVNWEIDNKRGEIWVHKLDTELLEGNSLKTPSIIAGYCPSDVRMSYEYSNTAFEINYEKGSIKFYEKPEGQVWGTFSYYNYTAETGPYILNENKEYEPITYTFALADDDLVDYKEVSIYSTFIKDEDTGYEKNQMYEFAVWDDNKGEYVFNEKSGKIITNITAYKDSGLIKFDKKEMEKDKEAMLMLPKDRMIADYTCHSFYRLTDDGYGNLYFYDQIIVADKTENYPDFTYVDLKIVNEGEATLKNGKIKFTYRGIASGTNSTTITSVLNPDRPWDVQTGTPDETFNQVGGVVSADYNFPTMTWSNALAIYEGAVDNDKGEKLTGGKTEISFKVDMEMKREIYLRVVWVMFEGGDENSPQYITPSTSGEKCFSGEIEGSFYTIQV